MPGGVMQLVDALEAGGAERVAVNLANLLARRGIASTLCATRRGGPLENELDPQVSLLKLNRRGRFDLPAVVRLALALKRNRIYVLHAHSTSLFVGALAAGLAGGVRLIWQEHCGAWGISNRPERWYAWAARRAAVVLVVDRDLERWAVDRLGCLPERVRYLPNFVQPPHTSGEVTGLPGSTTTRIIAVGNLRPQKDYPNLLEAAARVFAQYPGTQFLIAGGVQDESYARGLADRAAQLGITGQVHWLGRREDVPDLLAQCEIAVLASSSEGFPLALLEYGQAGCAVAATDTGQCAEVLENGRAGLLVPPGDPQALATALLRLLEDASLRRELGFRLRQRVTEYFSVEAILPQVLSVYRVDSWEH